MSQKILSVSKFRKSLHSDRHAWLRGVS